MSKVDKQWGRYLSFERIVKEDGYGPHAFRRACTYVAKCMEMGIGWFFYSGMVEDVKFLYVEHQWEESFNKAWKL